MRPDPPSPPPPPCHGVSSNRDWLPASPPWGSSNKEQLPNLTETKGRLQGIPPLSLQLACAFLLPSGPESGVGGGRRTSSACGVWQEVLPEGPLFPKAAKPGACPANCSAQKGRAQRSGPPASPLPPTLKSPLEENVNKCGYGDLALHSFWVVMVREGPSCVGLWEFILQ